jgi:hypothetical protein
LSTRPLWQSYQQSSSIKAGGTGKGNGEFGLTKYLFSYSEGILLIPLKSLGIITKNLEGEKGGCNNWLLEYQCIHMNSFITYEKFFSIQLIKVKFTVIFH